MDRQTDGTHWDIQPHTNHDHIPPHQNPGTSTHARTHAHTHTDGPHLDIHPKTALCPGLPRWAGTRKIKPIWILLKQETVSGSGFSWAICMSAPHSRQITTPAPYHSSFYRPDAIPAAEPRASKHWSWLRRMLPFLGKNGEGVVKRKRKDGISN